MNCVCLCPCQIKLVKKIYKRSEHRISELYIQVIKLCNWQESTCFLSNFQFLSAFQCDERTPSYSLRSRSTAIALHRICQGPIFYLRAALRPLFCFRRVEHGDPTDHTPKLVALCWRLAASCVAASAPSVRYIVTTTCLCARWSALTRRKLSCLHIVQES